MNKRVVKIAIVISFLVGCFSLYGCGGSTNTSDQPSTAEAIKNDRFDEEQSEVKDSFVPDCPEDQYNVDGNTGINLQMGGTVAAQGDYVYWLIDNCIFKQNVKEKGEVSLVYSFSGDSCRRLSVSGEWLYYYASGNETEAGLWRVRTDGSCPERLNDYFSYSNTDRYIPYYYFVSGNSLYIYKYIQVSSEKFMAELINFNADTHEEQPVFELGKCGISSSGNVQYEDVEWEIIGTEKDYIYLYKEDNVEGRNDIKTVKYAVINKNDYSDVKYFDGGIIPNIADISPIPSLIGKIINNETIYTYYTDEIIICDTKGNKELEYINFLDNGFYLSHRGSFATYKNPVVNIGPLGDGIVANMCIVEKDPLFVTTPSFGENIGICMFSNDNDLVNLNGSIVTEDIANEIYTFGDGYIYYIITRDDKEKEIYRIFYDGTGWERLPDSVDDLGTQTSASVGGSGQTSGPLKPGDTVYGVVEEKMMEGDSEVGGGDISYYVIKFDYPTDFELIDIEDGTPYLEKGLTEMTIYAPDAGNIGNLDMTPYLGKRISCTVFPSESYTRMGIVAEAISIELAE